MPASEARQQTDERNETQKTAKRKAKQETELAADRKAIADAMAELKAHDTETVIRSRAGLGNGQRFSRAWASLLRDGIVTERDQIKKGNGISYPAFAMANGT
jgi:hypothetical protein